MKLYLAIVLFWIQWLYSVDCSGQYNPNAPNLIPNSGFQFGNHPTPQCSNHYSPVNNIGLQGTNKFNNDMAYWQVARRHPANPTDNGSPDWIDPIDCGEHHHSGNSSWIVSSISSEESIRTGLIKNGSSYNLIGGRKYILKYKYFAESTTPVTCIRFIFSKWGEHWNSSSNNNQKWEAINTNLLVSQASSEWVQEIRSFIAPTGNDYNQLGNLVILSCDDYESDGSFNKFDIDDVELYEEENCSSVLAIENTIHWNENHIYQAGSQLYAGDNVNPLIDNGPVVVKYNSNIIYRAGNQVIVEPGFSTENGCYFEAVIEPCEANPCPSTPTLPNLINACFTNPTNIGIANPETGLSFDWSPATYLNNSTSSNPVFSPPSGTGTMTYTVTITSICGYIGLFPLTTSVTQQVTVYYNDNPDPNPSISIQNLLTDNYNFSFDASVGSQTEQICLNFYEVPTNALIVSYCLVNNQEFICCNPHIEYANFPEEIKELLSSCKDYNIEISAKNYCYSSVDVVSFLWDRVNTLGFSLIPNVVSFPDPSGYSNGVNDEYCIEVTGADSYVFSVWNNQTQVFLGSGPILASPQCIWNGYCNQAGSFICGPTNPIPDGTYYYILNIYNDCSIIPLDQNGFITVFHDDDPNRSSVIGSDTIDVDGNKFSPANWEFLIYPNPATESVNYILPTNPTVYIPYTVEVQNTLGQTVVRSETRTINSGSVNLNGLPSGHYLLKATTGNTIYTKVFVKE